MAPEISERISDYYGVSPDLLRMHEGKVPDDVLVILREHPEEIEALRRRYGQSQE